MKIDGNQIKVGNILEINSKLWKVLKTQHTQPGKGGAYLQVEMKEIREGTKMNERFRSSESVERAILDEKLCQYLYSENNKFVFMDNTTYEQIEIGDDIITDSQSKFLVENDSVNLQFYEGSVVAVELPDSITLKVEETEAVVKGQTAASSYKPAILDNGLNIQVPPFVEAGDEIIVDTRNLEYVKKI